MIVTTSSAASWAACKGSTPPAGLPVDKLLITFTERGAVFANGDLGQSHIIDLAALLCNCASIMLVKSAIFDPGVGFLSLISSSTSL